jgi:hypothetical protein
MFPDVEAISFFKSYLDANCWPLGMEDIETQPINVFPNPANQQLILQGRDLEKIPIHICDLFGNPRPASEISYSAASAMIDIGHLRKGIYILTYYVEGASVSYKICERIVFYRTLDSMDISAPRDIHWK